MPRRAPRRRWHPRRPFLVTPRQPPDVPGEAWFDSLVEAQRYAREMARRHRCHLTVWAVSWGRRGSLESLDPVQTVEPEPAPEPPARPRG
jgi:hypothetical protein